MVNCFHEVDDAGASKMGSLKRKLKSLEIKVHRNSNESAELKRKRRTCFSRRLRCIELSILSVRCRPQLKTMKTQTSVFIKTSNRVTRTCDGEASYVSKNTWP